MTNRKVFCKSGPSTGSYDAQKVTAAVFGRVVR